MSKQDFRHLFLPYLLKKTPQGYAVLNRAYAPLGFRSTDHAAEVAEDALAQLHIDARTAAALSCSGSEDTESIYLYDDASVPTSGAGALALYLDRLARLMHYTVP